MLISQASRMGLLSMWLYGFMLIAFSLYATHKLPSVKDRIKKPFLSRKPDSATPTITIFTAPNPFVGYAGTRQSVAIRSWLGLSPQISVVLFSQHESAASFAAVFGTRVSVDSEVDFTFLGTPFFHSMVTRSRSFASDISVFMNPETILLPDFVSTLSFVHQLDRDWLLVGSPRNISNLPFQLSKDGKHWHGDDGNLVKTKEMQEMVDRKTSQFNHDDWRMIVAWNNKESPLHAAILPPFLYAKGIHNHWVLNEALSSELRFVVESSWTISSFFIDDPRNRSEESNWEHIGNSLLGTLYGSSFFHKPNLSTVARVMKCGRRYLFIREGDSFVNKYTFQRRILRSWRKKDALACAQNIRSSDRTAIGALKKNQWKPSGELDLPFSMESLLSTNADRNKTIVLAVAGFSYKDMLMSWACRLRRLEISNFVVCALDRETYEFSILQGLPVFRDSSEPGDISFDNCHFGSKCFQKVTKVKSRIVLKMLKLGYNVLMSDVDVYWFKNPIPSVSSFGPGVLVAQSDEYNSTEPINLPRRLNSGFYFASSDGSTIAAMEKVVKHAATSGLSEQPSFYDVLCGEGGSNRMGDNRCVEPETGLTVHFLDRDLFPNGAYNEFWRKPNISEACLRKGCVVLHNNWVSGRRKKLERQVMSGLWEYDIGTRMCQHGNFCCCIGYHEEDGKSDLSIVHWRDSEMLKRCILLLGLRQSAAKDSRKKALMGITASFDVSLQFTETSLCLQLKDICVRVIHRGSREELYHHTVAASVLMKKYPGTHVARPDVFRDPHESILEPHEKLLVGFKYLIIPSTTAEKLKRRHQEKRKARSDRRVSDVDGNGDSSGDSIRSSRHRSGTSSVKRKGTRKKPFVPPIPPRNFRALPWEPSLHSVQEISP